MRGPVSHDHVEFEDCRRLWIAVLVNALEQHRKEIEKEARERGYKPVQSKVRARALRYVKSRDCKIVTHLAGFEYNADRMIRFLNGEGPAPLWARKETEE